MSRRTLRSERSNRGGSSVVVMQPGGGVSAVPPIPTGFVYLLGRDGAYLKGADGAYLYGVAP